jgi:ABC-2 type transport system ATP-binding protein
MSETHSIVFANVHRRFGDRSVLRGFDLQVRRGQIHALLGRNGSGKTTALRMLMGFLAPHAGSCTVLGVDSQRLRPEDRARIGYVSEDHRLYPTMRVGDVLEFEAATRTGFDRDLGRNAVSRCGIDPRAWVARLSRGQRAQLALIVAVAARPAVMVLDDPALGLDVVMRRELLDVMIDLLGDRGIAVLFSSHILTDVERMADRITILHEGRRIVDAALDDLKRRVQKRHWRPAAGNAPTLPELPGVLRAEAKAGGYNLTLLDFDSASEARLSADGARLSTALPLSLEDLFLDLTRGETRRIFAGGAGPLPTNGGESGTTAQQTTEAAHAGTAS